jgi:flavodoxin
MNKFSLLCLFGFWFMGICSKAPSPASKTLIIYLSRTNNTRAVAEIIHSYVGGKLVPLETRDPYPENYQEIVQQVANENARGVLPALKTKIAIKKFDVIFLGFPTWGSQLPPPVKSFLQKYNLSGKTIVPFNTHAGYGIGSSIQTLNELCPNSTILEAFSTTGGVERDGILFVMEGTKRAQLQTEIEQWLKKIRLLK